MDCKHENSKVIGRYTLDLGMSGEVEFTRIRCLDCGQIRMSKRYLDEDPEPKEEKPCEVNKTTPKKKRKSIKKLTE